MMMLLALLLAQTVSQGPQVILQQSSPGSAQTGNINVAGSIGATGGVLLTRQINPVNGTFSTSCTGGTLTDATTYFYRVTSTSLTGETQGSTETSLATGACSGANTSTVTVTWGAVAGSAGYNVYGRTTGAETKITASIGTTALSYTDTGSALSGALPTNNTTATYDISGSATQYIGHAGATTTLQGTISLVPNAFQFSLTNTTGAQTFSSTAATAGAGMRNANTRNITHSSSVSVPDCAGGTLNLTVTQFLDSGFATCGTAQTVNFPSWQGAGNIVQSLPGTPAIGDVVEFTMVSTAAAAVTVGAGTGGTISGTTTLNNTWRTFHCRLTNVTASSEAATCY